MSADLLRRAAAKIRENAEAATPGPWSMDPHSYGADRFVRRQSTSPRFCYPAHARVSGTVSYHEDEGALEAKRDAEHIASWHPDVALAVAKLLDNLAVDYEAIDLDGDTADDAFALARAYLGEA